MEKTVQKIGTIRGTSNIRPRGLVGSMARGFLYLVAIAEPCHSPELAAPSFQHYGNARARM